MSTSAHPLRGPRAGVYALYRGLTAVFAVGVVAQFFLAGLGAFGALHERTSDAFAPHVVNGEVLSLLSLLMLIVVAVARPGRGLVPASGGLFAAMVVQNLLAGFGEDDRWVGALHPVNALVITVLSAWLVTVCFRAQSHRRPATPAAGAPAPRVSAEHGVRENVPSG